MLRFLILFFTCCLLPILANGQNVPLFVIVSCSEGVMLDGKVVSPGQFFSDSANKLKIPKEGYVGIVTNEGYSYLFKSKISIKTKRISKYVFKRKYSAKLRGMAIHESPIRLIDDTHFHASYLMGDSILLGWWPTKSKIVQVKFTNMHDRVLRIDSAKTNWVLLNVKELFNMDSTVILSLYENDTKNFRSAQYLIKRPSGSRLTFLSFDLDRIQFVDNRLFLKMVLFELYDLFYDHLRALYQLERSNYQPQSKIFANYINQLKKKYQFELFDFHK
jgi:hypothetical protein